MSKLFFLTSTFPFLPGEQFIETEINYLAGIGYEVILMPLKKGHKIRNFPSNIKLDLRLVCSSEFSLVKFIKLLASKYLYSEVFLKPSTLFSRNKLLKTLRYIYVGENIARELASCFDNLNNSKVLIYSYWANESAFSGAILKKRFPSIRAVTRCHRFDLYRERNKGGFMPLGMSFLKELDAIFPCSSDGAKYVVKEYNVPPNKVITARLGTLDYGHGKGFNEAGKFHIVSCSYLVPVKRVHLIIEALMFLQGSMNLTWTHIGGGRLENDLQKMARSKLDKVEVKWMGEISNHEVVNFFKDEKVDCFINVSSSEGIPVSIMEATSFGIPTVALNVGGVGEIVNERNGMLLGQVATPREIAVAITSIDNKNSVQFRRQVKEVWDERYNADKNYVQFQAMLATFL